MSGNQPGRHGGEPLNMGITLSAPISSVVGSSSLVFAQPLLAGRVFVSSAVLIGSEAFLFIIGRLFKVETLPILDATNGQIVQMPLTELQEFLRWLAEGSNPSTNPYQDQVTKGINTTIDQEGLNEGTDVPGLVTVTTPEAPLVVSIYISADYSNKPFTSSVALFIPILTLPGVRGALPLLILGLISTIFVRAVVPPESSGSRPLPKPKTRMNNPLTYSPNDLLDLLAKFGKHFGTK